MKYAQFDVAGVLVARYDTDINKVVPGDAVQLTEDEFQRTLAEVDGQWQRVNGVMVKGAFPARVVDTKAVAQAALIAIDLASIRALREYIASKADAPQIIKDREAAAVLERGKL